MQGLVSIIIPTLNEEKVIRNTLKYLKAIPGNFEVLVADGGSDDRTFQFCTENPNVRPILCPSRGRAVQMNYAAKMARGNILFFLHADSRPPSTLFRDVMSALRDQRVLAGSFYIKFDYQHWMLRFISWVTTFDLPFFNYGDHGLFIRKKDFESMGGFPELPIMEDLEMHRTLRKRGKFLKIHKPVLTSARRFINNGILIQSCQDAAILVAYYLRVSPNKLKRYYADSKREAR